MSFYDEHLYDLMYVKNANGKDKLLDNYPDAYTRKVVPEVSDIVNY